MHAQIIDGTIVGLDGVPASARRLDTGEWVLGLRDANAATQQACGWYAITDTPRPDDTDTTTFDQTIELVDGVPTVVWAERTAVPPAPDPIVALQAQVAAQQAVIDALLGVEP